MNKMSIRYWHFIVVLITFMFAFLSNITTKPTDHLEQPCNSWTAHWKAVMKPTV